MKTKKIGIIRSLYYHTQGVFIKNYFEYLGYNIIISKNINKKIILTKRCREVNNYLKHIIYLKNKCDFIIVPYQKKAQCPFLDNILTISNNYIDNIISYNIDKPTTLIIRSIKITKNIPKIIISYILAIHDYNKYQKKQIKIQEEKTRSISSKVLIVKNTLLDIKITKSKYTILYSNYLPINISIDYYNNFKEKGNEFKKEIGSIYYYYNMVERIYIITNKDCYYKIKNHLNCIESKIKKKITIINI